MTPETSAVRKNLGAYYTDEAVVDFLVRWGIAHAPGLAVMDPACGDGRFLAAAAGQGATRLVGCDIDPAALDATSRSITSDNQPLQLMPADFFTIDPTCIQAVDLVVGNPPFIRYQRFTGESRAKALASALRLGVRLTRLTSTWAPFLLHAVQFLRPGGALAMVVPAEIVQTHYGVLTLRALCERFAHVQLLTFARNFFAGAQTETYLLLAEGFGGTSRSVELRPMASIADLAGLDLRGHGVKAETVDVPESGPIEFAQAFMTPGERHAWQSVTSHPKVVSLATCGVLANGYVSGDNRFFHRTSTEARAANVPAEWLRPTARNTRSLSGLSFSADDLLRLEARGVPHHLLHLPADDLSHPFPAALRRITRAGEALGVDRRFKCRTRTPWWRVPGTHVPDLFLPYMIGRKPMCSVNLAGATYTNTLHGLRLFGNFDPYAVAVALLSSLSLLSMELRGRSYGGGVLKLEPSEMNRVQLAVPELDPLDAETIDGLLRAGNYAGAVEVADDAVLRRVLGLDDETVRLLQSARARLVERRYERNRGGGTDVA